MSKGKSKKETQSESLMLQAFDGLKRALAAETAENDKTSKALGRVRLGVFCAMRSAYARRARSAVCKSGTRRRRPRSVRTCSVCRASVIVRSMNSCTPR